jgi:hypothetical protein
VKNLGAWIGVSVAAFIALIFGIVETKSKGSRLPQKPVKAIVPQVRASGFTIKGEVIRELDLRSKVTKLKSAIWATGPMSAEEVIMFEGFSTLILPDKTKKVFGPITSTFRDRLESILAFDNPASGSVVRIQGSVRVFRRERIKVERTTQPDASNCFFLNTGTVTFRKIKESNPPQMEVICKGLMAVHDHGMELMMKDKKTVAARILLSAGRQVIERENLPYPGKTSELEPVFIWQLIPKRKEPMDITLQVPETPTITR